MRTKIKIEDELSRYPQKIRNKKLPGFVLDEAKKRILDTLACFYGAVQAKPAKALRKAFLPGITGKVALWGSSKQIPSELAAWMNGTCVRTLDYNDTYLSLEPCHPSDLIASLWAACELSQSKRQGFHLLKGLVLGYEVLCRLCDSTSLRRKGWDHVTYLPIASAVGCAFILGLKPQQTRHAIALSLVGQNALRQTRMGTISDWKASCAAYAARSGLWAAQLALTGFTGPDDIFAGPHGFFKQVSGPFSVSKNQLGSFWKIMGSHIKYAPAEHHAQSAIEAAFLLRPLVMGQKISEIVVETFNVAVDIIGSEPEKWKPQTRETADHSLPYLVAVTLLDGHVTLKQYEAKRFLDPDVRQLMKIVKVKRATDLTKLYPKDLPARLRIKLTNGSTVSQEVRLPKGYAGRPMSWEEVKDKFHQLAAAHLPAKKRDALVRAVHTLDRMSSLSKLTKLMKIPSLP